MTELPELFIKWLLGLRLLLLCGKGRLRGGTSELVPLLRAAVDRRVRRGEPGYWNLVGLLLTTGASSLGGSSTSTESDIGMSNLVLVLGPSD